MTAISKQINQPLPYICKKAIKWTGACIEMNINDEFAIVTFFVILLFSHFQNLRFCCFCTNIFKTYIYICITWPLLLRLCSDVTEKHLCQSVKRFSHLVFRSASPTFGYHKLKTCQIHKLCINSCIHSVAASRPVFVSRIDVIQQIRMHT